MGIFKFDTTAYLQRLRLSESISPTTKGLRTLQRAQFFNIPFENFDIQLGRGIDLDPARLFDKLVHHPRGGYCFELNGLFLMALRAFEFEARPLLARVHTSGEPSGRGHQLALVDLDDRHGWQMWVWENTTVALFAGTGYSSESRRESNTPH